MTVTHAMCWIPLACALGAAILGTTGCTSMSRVPVVNVAPQPSLARVSAGDKLRVTMRDGRRAEFRVKAANPDVIVATDGERYAMGDVVTIERRTFSWRKTTALAAGIYAAVAWLVVWAGPGLFGVG